MQNGKCEHGSRWVKVTEKWYKVVLAPDCECTEPDTLFDLVATEPYSEDEDYDDDPNYADGYADDPYDGQACNGCGVDPCICVQLDEEDEQ